MSGSKEDMTNAHRDINKGTDLRRSHFVACGAPVCVSHACAITQSDHPIILIVVQASLWT
jgi:hypothetical protein